MNYITYRIAAMVLATLVNVFWLAPKLVSGGTLSVLCGISLLIVNLAAIGTLFKKEASKKG